MSGAWTQGITMMPPSEQHKTAQGGLHGAVPMEPGAPPSSYAVAAVVNGEPGGWWRLLGVTFTRAVFIGPGIWIATRLTKVDVEKWQLIAMTMGASATISGGLLIWYWIRSKLAAAGRDQGPHPQMAGVLR